MKVFLTIFAWKDPDPEAGPVLVSKGSGCGSGRPKNIRILRIRIRSPNTGLEDPLVERVIFIYPWSYFLCKLFTIPFFSQLTENDVLYSPLPMYHTSAGAMATGNAMMEGLTLISRYRKYNRDNYTP
jgi:hypothetical protein